MNELEKLKRKEFVSYALTKDNGDDVYEITKQIEKFENKKGKAFANRKPKLERNENDFYETPYSLTWELQKLNIIEPNKTIIDPCCGNYAISKWFRKTNKVTEKSLEYGNDFFKDEYKENQFDYAILNPPFDLFDKFIEKSKIIANTVIAIGKTDYFSCYQRLENGLWNGLSDIYIFNRKVDYQFPIFEDGCFGVGSLTTGWFVWNKDYDDDPKIHFIDVQKYATRGNYKSWLKKQKIEDIKQDFNMFE